ncbi:MAG: hypothetical protein K6G71_04700 [Clostridiales bacterium]|nr:hypothetical protein [Clostridiales bacterium]
MIISEDRQVTGEKRPTIAKRKNIIITAAVLAAVAAVFAVVYVIAGQTDTAPYTETTETVTETVTDVSGVPQTVPDLPEGTFSLLWADCTDEGYLSYVEYILFDHERRSAACYSVPLSADDGGPAEFAAEYVSGGMTGLCEAFTRVYGVGVDKYAMTTNSGLSRLVIRLGPVKTEVEKNVSFIGENVSLQLRVGEQELDSSDFPAYMTYAEVGADAMILRSRACADMLRSWLTVKNAEKAADLFPPVVNSMTTDISVFDYTGYIPFIQAMAQQGYEFVAAGVIG